MFISRALFAIQLLFLGAMIYFARVDMREIGRSMILSEWRIESRIDTIADRLDRLQRRAAQVGKPRVPPVRYLIKPPTEACFPRS